MKKNLLFCVLLLIIAFQGCRKSDSFREELLGEWKVKMIGTNDVSSFKMTLNFEENKNLKAFDGCNWGSTEYTAGKGNTIRMGYPSFTYMYCNEYHGVFGPAVENARKFSVASGNLTFYSENGDLLLTAVR